MAVTPANQTFRGGVMPVLLQLDVNLDLPDQDVEYGEVNAIAAFVAFNMNNPTCLVDSVLIGTDTNLSGNQSIAIGQSLLCANSQNDSFTTPDNLPSSEQISLISVFNKGQAAKAGFGDLAGVGNSILPGKKRWSYALVISLHNEDDSPEETRTLSGSSFSRLRFVNSNSVVRITA
jgi:hypothetical protein